MRTETGGVPPVAFDLRKIVIARNVGSLAACRDRRRRRQRPVAVDDEPRIRLRDHRRIENRGEVRSDTARADVPGDVPCELGVVKTERSERTRNSPAGMVANQHERPSAVFAFDAECRRLVIREQSPEFRFDAFFDAIHECD